MLKIFVGKSKKPKDAQELKWESLSIEELLSLAASQSMFDGKESTENAINQPIPTDVIT